MRRFAMLAVALAVFGASACDDNNPTGPSNSGPIVFTAQLSAANEVPNRHQQCRVGRHGHRDHHVQSSRATAPGNITGERHVERAGRRSAA